MRHLIKLACLVPGLMVGPAVAQIETHPTQVEAEGTASQGPRVEGQLLEYATGGTTYQGYLAHNANDTEPRPAVLVVHEWWGLDDYARARADQLAALGFVAFAVDMYGNGKTVTHPDEAGEFSRQVMQDWPATRAKLEAAMARVREHPAVAKGGVAAIGYCFGGGIVMNMALSGMPIKAAISFHGSPTQAASNPQPFGGLVQIHNGAADPLVERGALHAMVEALEGQGGSVEVIHYPGAMHGFSNPYADAKAMEYSLPLEYHAAADAASWQAALLALDRALNDN